MIGFTISQEQARICQQNGHEAITWNYRIFYSPLKGKIDHIVMMGSSEHINTGPSNHYSTYIKKKAKMVELLSLCKGYFKTDNRVHRTFYSGLHINSKYYNSFGMYVLERMYGGDYQLSREGLDIFASAIDAGYTICARRDSTKKYYMPTVLDERHFGTPNSLLSSSTINLAILTVFYPQLFGILYMVSADTGCGCGCGCTMVSSISHLERIIA